MTPGILIPCASPLKPAAKGADTLSPKLSPRSITSPSTSSPLRPGDPSAFPRDMVSPTLAGASRVHVFFGTVTGNAEEIARRIAAELAARGVDAGTAVSLADFASAPAFTTGAPAATVVFVASTTGDGDPPDAIRPFMRYLRKCAKDRTALAHIRYAVLGLGDTNYEQFCNTAKKIDAGLLAAGAKPFLPRGLADDGTGLEAVVEPWIAALYESLDLLVDAGSVQPVSDTAAKTDEAPKKDAATKKLTTLSTITTTSSASAISSSPPASLISEDASVAEAVPESAPGSKRISNVVETLASAEVVSSTDSALRARAPQGGLSRETKDSSVSELVKAVAALELGFSDADLPALLPLSIEVHYLDQATTSSEKLNAAEPVSTSLHYNPTSTIHARVIGARKLTSERASKSVYHIELDCASGSNQFTYSPGDAFGVLAENTDIDVERLLRCMAVDADSSCTLTAANVADSGSVGTAIATGSVGMLIRQRVDLRAVPKKTILRALSEHCSNIADRKTLLHLCSKPGRQDYVSKIVDAQTGICDVLETFAPSCRPPLDLILDQLLPLAPRYYSAASAPQRDGAVVHFAFSVVNGGLATTELAKRCELFLSGADPDKVPLVLLVPRPSDSMSSFKPPASLATPYIMIGPGTGVAPFRGFLRQRDALLGEDREGGVDAAPDAIGKCMLFFGCRNELLDYLYADELEGYASSGTLSVLDVSFSRDGPAKIYVQDRLAQRADEVAAVLTSGGTVYVCGDGGGMAADVDAALRAVVRSKLCGGDDGECKAYMKQLTAERRYLRDIWYFGAVHDE
jgi:methionine synthase reductase